MNTPLSKRTVQNSSVTQSKQKSSSSRQQVSFEDKRASTIQQQKIIDGIHKSSEPAQAKAKTPTASSANSNAVIQRYTIWRAEEKAQKKMEFNRLFPNETGNHELRTILR
jgi:hypothetical protein